MGIPSPPHYAAARKHREPRQQLAGRRRGAPVPARRPPEMSTRPCSPVKGAVPPRLPTPVPEEMMNQDEPSKDDWCRRIWNGMDLLKDATENKHVLPTGLQGLDTLLGGGLRQGQLTEVSGPSSSGKTQVCLHSASHVAVKHMGVVMYLDTSNSFSPSRIATIIDGTNDLSDQRGFDLSRKERLKTMMKSIICESVFDIFGMFEVLHQLEVSLLNDKVKSGGRKICLLIIDSISSLLAPIIGGKYPQGRSMMISVAIILKKLAYEHNLSVLVTNHTVSAGNGAVKPALGESWKAVPHVRLMISREHGSNICTATVLKHTLLASGRTAKFVVGRGDDRLAVKD